MTTDTLTEDVRTLEEGIARGVLLHSDAEALAGAASRLAWRIMIARHPGADLLSLARSFREWSDAAWHACRQQHADCPRLGAVAFARHVLGLLRPVKA